MRRDHAVLAIVTGLGCVLGACSSGSKQAGDNPQGVGAIKLFLTNTPGDVRCLELDVMSQDRSVTIQTRRFDVTPGQPATASATGLPLEWVLLSEKAYNVPCDDVTSDTPVTWFSPSATAVQLSNGQVVSVNIVLHPVGNGAVGVTSDFQAPPDTCTGWTCSPWSYGTGNGCNCNCGCWDPDCDAQDGGQAGDGGAGSGGGSFSSACSNWQLCVQPGVCEDVACAGWNCPVSWYGDGICQPFCGCPDPDCESADAGSPDSGGGGGSGGSGGSGGGSPDSGVACSTCAWGQTFESNNGGFTVSGSLTTWAWGVPTGNDPNSPGYFGGPVAHGGSKLWATNLSGNYRANEDGYITSPSINLSAHAGRSVTVSWWEWAYMFTGFGSVDVSKDGGTTWSTIHTLAYLGSGWTRVAVLLDSSYAVSNFVFRFHFTASSQPSTYAGWYIDDVCVAPGGLAAYHNDFEANDAGYTTSGTTSWAWGAPTSGPYSAHSGSNVWATNLSGDYSSNENGYLTSPAIDLSALAAEPSIDLRWWWYLYSEPSYDFATVEASANGGGSWTPVSGPGSGVLTGWQQQSVILSTAYAVSNFRLRFHFTSDAVNNYAGWYVDDVSIQGTTIYSCDPTTDSPNPDGGVGGTPDAGISNHLFASSSVPAGHYSGTYEFGTKFSADVAGQVTELRYYHVAGDTGLHVGHLWDGAGNLLETAAFPAATSEGWQSVSLPTPVGISAGTTYTVSYSTDTQFAWSDHYFDVQADNPPLHAPVGAGVYSLATGTFPTSVWENFNYWVDVSFSSGTGGGTPDAGSPDAGADDSGHLFASPSVPAGHYPGTYEFGTKFSADVAGQVTELRYYHVAGDTGLHVGHLWDGAGNLLETAAFPAATLEGWQSVSLPTPVGISAGTTYTVSYSTDTQFVWSANYFDAQVDNPPLHAPVGAGVYSPATGTFPTGVYANYNYWVDVSFSPGH